MSRSFVRVVLAVVAIVCVASLMASAQTTTTKTEKAFEIIAVNGNTLVVKLPEGTRELTVPEDFTLTVDGKPVAVKDLTPGMKGTATITTTTKLVPVVVTEIKDGTVMKAMGTTVVVQTADGIKMFSQGDLDKRGVEIFKDGKVAEVSDLRQGDKLSAMIVTTHPPKLVTEKQVAALTEKKPAVAKTPAGTPPETGKAPTAEKLPKTAGPLPLLALAGILSTLTGAGLTLRRRLS
jgi:hypothetical protein